MYMTLCETRARELTEQTMTRKHGRNNKRRLNDSGDGSMIRKRRKLDSESESDSNDKNSINITSNDNNNKRNDNTEIQRRKRNKKRKYNEILNDSDESQSSNIKQCKNNNKSKNKNKKRRLNDQNEKRIKRERVVQGSMDKNTQNRQNCNKLSKLGKKVLCFENVLLNVFEHLRFEEIIKFRMINKYYNEILSFSFDMKIVNSEHIVNSNKNATFDVYFESNEYKYIRKLLCHHFCDNLSNIAWYYFQCQNVKLVNWCFDKNKERTNEMKEITKHNARKKYLFSIDFDIESMTHNYKIENEKYENKKNWHCWDMALLMLTNEKRRIFYEVFKIGFWLHESSFSLINNNAPNSNSCNKTMAVIVDSNNIFKFIKHQMICIDKMFNNSSKNQNNSNKKDEISGIDMFKMQRANEFMTLAILNDIKPMKKMFENLLLSNETYRNWLPWLKHNSIKDSFDISRKYSESFNILPMRTMGHSLPYLFAKMGRECLSTFSQNCVYKTIILPIRPLLTDVSIKGNFDFYEKYIESLRKKDIPIEANASITEGMFGLMVLFMRLDLVDNYVHCANTELFHAREMTYFLLNPQYLNEYKKNLEENILITPLTKDECFEFDLLNNKRYLPENRIKMIAKLCFCPMIASSLLWRKGNIYIEPTYDLYNLVMRLYNDFDYFCKLWLINDYTHLKNDKTKQEQIYKDFQIAIQGLVCFCTFYLCGGIGYSNSPGNSMIDIERDRPNAPKDDIIHKLKTSNNEECIYFKPENEDDIDNLFYYLTRKFPRDERIWYTQQPGIDYQFRENIYKKQPLMKMKDTNLLMHKLFELAGVSL